MNCRLHRLILAIVSAAFAVGVSAQPYPTKPIRIVVPFPAGGTTDVLARAAAQKLTESLGQAAVVDNRPGAGGNIGAELVAKSPPDGYTLLMGTVGTHAINPSLYPKMPYDHVKDFAPVILVAGVPNVLVINPALPGELGAGIDRLRQGESRQAQFRVVGQRDVDPPVRRAIQVDGGRADDARPVQGQRAGAAGSGRRPGAAHVRQPSVVAGAHQGGQVEGARRDEFDAGSRAARRAHAVRIRAAGVRGLVMVRPARARGNAAADHRQGELRKSRSGSPRPRRRKSCSHRVRTPPAARPRTSRGTSPRKRRNGKRW